MYLADRLRQFREAKKLSQGDVERRTGLLRCYISRVENGHTVPSLETLEKLARALEVPVYQLFYEDGAPQPAPPNPREHKLDWASSGRGARTFARIRQAVSLMRDKDRALLLHFASKLAKATPRKA